MKKVLILNQHTNNVGDEAAGLALIDVLLSSRNVAGVEIIYNGPGWICADSERVLSVRDCELSAMGVVGILSLVAFGRAPAIGRRLRAARRYKRHVRNADVVIVAPCGANIGVYRGWRFLTRILIAVRLGARPVFFWNTLGSSGSKVFDHIALHVLRRSSVYCREIASCEYLQSKGIEARRGYDAAFLSPRVDSGRSRGRYMAVVPCSVEGWHPAFNGVKIDWVWSQRVAKEVARFAKSNRLEVVILPHLGSESERRFDLEFRCALLSAGMEVSEVTSVDGPISAEIYEEWLARSWVVVGGRYHSIVLAGKNGVPFVSVSYENKMHEVCEYLGVPEWECSLKTLSGPGGESAFLGVLSGISSDGEEIAASVARRVEEELRPRLVAPLSESGLLDGL